MTLSKRELAFEAEYPGGMSGDWWHLVMDSDCPGIYIEHTWIHTNAQGSAESGTERFGINDFLTLATDEPARATLLTALSEIFRTPRTS
jgi:hypothetical protein